MRRKARQATKAENRPRFWGRHAVAAALANPDRGHRPHLGDPRGRRRLRHSGRDSGHLCRRRRSRPDGAARRAAPGRGRRGRAARRHPARRPARQRTGRPAAGRARPGHRSAQCRRDPALGRRLRRARPGHPGPARPAGIRRARQGGERRAGDRALGARRQPRPRARGDGSGGLLADRPDRRGRD